VESPRWKPGDRRHGYCGDAFGGADLSGGSCPLVSTRGFNRMQPWKTPGGNRGIGDTVTAVMLSVMLSVVPISVVARVRSFPLAASIGRSSGKPPVETGGSATRLLR
jgi:hypothetical protein